jgi:hypothetical protein
MESIILNGQEVFPIVTSHSIDGTFKSCERKFEFAHVFQRVPDIEDSGYAADAGTALHEGVQAWASHYMHPDRPRTPESYEEAVDKGLFAFLRFWPYAEEYYAMVEKKPIAKQRSLGQALALFFKLVESNFWDEYEVAILPDKKPAIEIPWRIIHESAGIHLDALGRPRVIVTQGKIDFVLRHKESGIVVVVDLKTTVKSSDTAEATYRFSGQAVGYSIVLSGATGFDFSGGLQVIYLIANFLSQEITPLLFKISPEEVRDYILTRNDLISDIRRNLERGFWPRTQHGCESWGSPCSYLKVCHLRDSGLLSIYLDDETGGFKEKTRIYPPQWVFKG